MVDGRKAGLIVAVIAVLSVIAIYWHTGTLWHNQYDDSYITYRYAVNLAEGRGLVFNEGEHTDAASSFLYTVVLAAFYRVGLTNLEAVSFFLNMVSIGLVALFVFLCSFILSRNMILSSLLGLICSTHGYISLWSVFGMDTVPFAALMCAAIWAIITRKDTISLVLVICLIMMRFEGMLFVPFWWWATGRKWKDAAIVVAFFVIYYGARFAYYDTVIPHSFWFKTISVYYEPNPLKFIYSWHANSLMLPLITVTSALFYKRLRWLSIFSIVSFVICMCGPNSDWDRYSAHLLPVMAICSAPLITRREIYIPVILSLLVGACYSLFNVTPQAQNIVETQVAREETGNMLRGQSTTVLSGDIGMIAYRAIDCRFIDILGLTSSDVLDNYRNGRNIDNILKEKKPTLLADTFEILNKSPNYYRFHNSDLMGVPPSTPINGKIIAFKKIKNTYGIGIARLDGGE